MSNHRLSLAVLLYLLALAAPGCGGGDDESSTEADSEQASCVDMFTAAAPQGLPSIARLSHSEGAPLTTGHYTGADFDAEIYDETTEGTGEDATVATGACVITEVDKSFGPLYLFVETADGSWHRLLESDPDVPLLPDPESQLEDVAEVEIEEIGA